MNGFEKSVLDVLKNGGRYTSFRLRHRCPHNALTEDSGKFREAVEKMAAKGMVNKAVDERGVVYWSHPAVTPEAAELFNHTVEFFKKCGVQANIRGLLDFGGGPGVVVASDESTQFVLSFPLHKRYKVEAQDMASFDRWEVYEGPSKNFAFQALITNLVRLRAEDHGYSYGEED